MQVYIRIYIYIYTCVNVKISYLIIHGGFLVAGRVHSSAFHYRYATCCGMHADFANESVCLMVDGAWNEVVTDHRSQEVLKIKVMHNHPRGNI
jgi:hypothetical protein